MKKLHEDSYRDFCLNKFGIVDSGVESFWRWLAEKIICEHVFEMEESSGGYFCKYCSTAQVQPNEIKIRRINRYLDEEEREELR